jgi:hypothetical protein
MHRSLPNSLGLLAGRGVVTDMATAGERVADPWTARLATTSGRTARWP